jgi:hypothetical protein
VNQAIPSGGNDVLFQNYLNGIGKWLKEALWPGSIRPLANLKSAKHSALEEDEVHHHYQNEDKEYGYADKRGNKVSRPVRDIGRQPIMELLKNAH